ncbi:MAG: carbohydrate-binding protein [Methylomonas sp.]|nr:carbohydrate-binding protein [Methylomonas sp.]
MANIELLAVENTITRKKNSHQQVLQFLMAVDDPEFHKQVDVIWCGHDGIWHTLEATYQGPRGDSQEFWLARTTKGAKSVKKLPGDISFALRLRNNTDEFWNNNQGWNHHCRQNSGLTLFGESLVQNLSLKQRLDDEQQYAQIKVALSPSLHAESVIIHWTTDNWQNTRQTDCHPNKRQQQHDAQLWTARLKIGDTFALEYSIQCKTRHQELWDNNLGKNYRISREPLRVMILNLHCYQEDNQDEKFTQIAKAIDEQAVDIVCLQEVAEHWNDGHGDWPSNAANIINRRLKQVMHIYTDWSHLGFDKYREGVAILSRHPLSHTESRYVSDSQDPYNINSRKVVMAHVQLPYLGAVNIFSAHLSWWEGGFERQFQRLCEWADSQLSESVQTTLLCGDFNIEAGSAGYQQVVNGNQYEDQFLAANRLGLFEQIFRVDDPHWGHLLADDYRIDYIFMNKSAYLRVKSARVLFTENDYGPVSDHCGYLMEFEPK